MTASTSPEAAELQLREALALWFQSPLGQSLQAAEARRLEAILPQLYATFAIQLGVLGDIDLLASSTAPTRIVCDLRRGFRAPSVCSLAEELPFDGKRANLMLLPHTLDFALDPHQVLREVDRVLMPEGHVIILGFNPLSLWGIWRLFKQRAHAPWCGHFLQLARVKDWLALLDFEFTHGSMLYYRPPVRRDRWRGRLRFMEQIGDRWWPLGAAVYVIVAKKREAGMTLVGPRWRRSLIRMTQPAVRSSG